MSDEDLCRGCRSLVLACVALIAVTAGAVALAAWLIYRGP